MVHRLFLLLALVGGFLALSSAVPSAARAGDDLNELYVDVQGSGTVLAASGFSCSSSCEHTYPTEMSVINAVAQPAPGWKFVAWVDGGEGAHQPGNKPCVGSTSTICQVLYDSLEYRYAHVNALFEQLPDVPIVRPALTVSVAGSGSGSVTGTGISCPGDCSQEYLLGTTVTLTAAAGPLSAFSGWSGACSGSGPTCHITMAQSRSVTATFVPDVPVGDPALARTLEVELAGAGSGSVTSGAVIVCPSDCTQEYQVSAVVALTALPAAGSVFAGWSGDCTGTGPACQVTMSSSRNVTATFELAPAGGSGGGGGQPDPGQSDPGQPGGGQPGPGQSQPQGCTITGTPGDDVLTGTPGDDVICGLGGKDTLVGRSGDDVLLGGDGADTLLGGAGTDVLEGGAGSDELVGGKGNDRLTGGAGRDHLAGAGGRDTLLARDGKGDLVDGGAGVDKARVDVRKDSRTAVETLF
jgi:uncharacterized repeat protein (TIGR02543 family)